MVFYYYLTDTQYYEFGQNKCKHFRLHVLKVVTVREYQYLKGTQCLQPSEMLVSASQPHILHHNMMVVVEVEGEGQNETCC